MWALLAHELGHSFSLQHVAEGQSGTTGDVMEAPIEGDRIFSARERLVMHLMLQRFGGTTFPDNDRQATVTTSSNDVLTVVIVD